MTYPSVHTGPEIDAAVSVLSDVQDIRTEVAADKATVTTLAGQTATNATLAQTAATNAQADAASALASKNEAHTSAQTAGAHAANSDSARALSVVARNGSEEARDSAWEAEEEVRYLLGESEATIDSIRAEILRQKYGAGPYPSLDIGFVGARVLDRRVTFTRPTDARYWDSLGMLQTAGPNEPRFDYDPVTGESLGLLIERNATNLVRWSSGFDQTYWTKNNATVIASPDLSISADSPAWSLSPDSSNGFHEIVGAAQGVIGRSYVISVIAKPGTFPRIRVAGRSSGNWVTLPQGVFDLSTGAVLISNGDKPCTMKYLGNGYYLCSIYGTCANNESIGMNAGPIPPGMTTVNFDGSIYQGNVYILAAQMEEGPAPTSYIKTEASQVTRSASLPEIPTDRFIYNEDEGTFVVHATLPETVTYNTILKIGTDTGGFFGLSIGTRVTTLGVREFVVENRTDAGIRQLVWGTFQNPVTVAVSYKKDGTFRVSLNGSTVRSAENIWDGVATSAFLGAGGVSGVGAATRRLDGHMSYFSYYPRALSDAQLVELTTI